MRIKFVQSKTDFIFQKQNKNILHQALILQAGSYLQQNSKVKLQKFIFMVKIFLVKKDQSVNFQQQLNNMQNIFQKLQALGDLKFELRQWCQLNGIKISFIVNMSISKSKNIFRKLQNKYKKGYGKVKTRWLQNQLKLFYFALLAVSVLNQIKISQFAQQQWIILEQAFPNKLQSILEYEAKNFIIDKNSIKKKWEESEDKLLTKIIQQKQEQPRWNQIAIQLYIESNRQFFRNGKQCRQRWLNHLDNSINHEKWTVEEDLILIKGVQEHCKKWSRIMICFQNQRTQHMIKNRFLSLILKCRKTHPFIQDQGQALKIILCQMGLFGNDLKNYQDQFYSQRKLRPKKNYQQLKQQQSKQSCESENNHQFEENDQQASQSFEDQNQKINETIIIPQVLDQQLLNPMDCINFTNYGGIPTPSPTYVSHISFVNFNPLFASYGYFQYYMNNFYSQIGTNNLEQSNR